MDNQEVEKCAQIEDGSNLNRNRSFKSKQLVRSQAIRETASPPRTVSPSVRNETASDVNPKNVNKVNVKVTAVDRTDKSDSSQESDVFNYKEDMRKPVEIQITQGTWDEGPPHEQCGRTRRWLSDSSRESTRDLLSNNPRVACVCGTCAACPQCRGRRRRHICTIKQDSGICPDECPDCSDTEPSGTERKAGSLDTEEQYYCRCPERRDKPKNMLSRTDSDEKSEPTGLELVAFIKETLNKNSKDRMTLLKVERELYSLVNDSGRCIVKFPVMTSYGRMLVHRCASLFQLSHHLDHTNKNCVIVSKSGTSGGRIPCTNFKTWCVANFPPPSPQRPAPDHTALDGPNAKSILKRDAHSLDEPSSGALAMNRSKSLEQREREYERVRRRIFSSDNCNQEESQWPWISGPVKLLTPEPGRNKLLKVQSLEQGVGAGGRGRRGVGGGGGGAGAVAKSHSFGGYGEPPPRALSTQGDLASSSWRLSPSSSGYKTLSLRSTDSVTPSPTGGGTPEPGAGCPATPHAGAVPCPVVWAVTDMACVPPGALVLHPQTGRPMMNADGTIYHFDPSNPPVIYHEPADYQHAELPKTDQNNDKRRGRLEKQDSFIDHEAECQPAEEYYSEYQERPPDKVTPKPVTPTSHQYEGHDSEPADQPVLEAGASQTELAASRGGAYEPTGHKAGTFQDTVYYGPYANMNNIQYTEEVTSSPQMTQYIQTEMANMHSMVSQGKVAPILQDPNMRPLSLTNMVYQSNIPGYQFIPNQCRMETVPQVYQPLMTEDKNPTPPQPVPDNTFRIDPSYPYAAVDYAAAYGTCVDSTPLQAQPQPQRSYSVPYSPADLGAMQPAIPSAIPPVYPLSNLILPQTIQYPVQYPDPVQWAQLQSQAMCPVVYPQHYAHYNIVYPQMVPQQYPVCAPLHPALGAQRERERARVRPAPPPDRPAPTRPAINNITHIREGFIHREQTRRNDWRKNSGTGILGSYPVNTFNGRLQPGAADSVQLNPTARAIVNSIRNMQTKNTYQQMKRFDYNGHGHQRGYDSRPDRRRHEERPDADGGDRHRHYDRTHYHDKNTFQDRNSFPERNTQDRNSFPERNTQDKNTFPDRNIQDKNSFPERNIHDKNGFPDRNTQDNNGFPETNIQDKNCYPEKNTQDKSSFPERNIQDKSSFPERNVQGKNGFPDMNTQDKNSFPERNTQDKNSFPERNTQDNNRFPDSNIQNKSSCPERTIQDENGLPDMNSVPDRNNQDKNSLQDKSNVQDTHVQDKNSYQDKKCNARDNNTPNTVTVANSSYQDKSNTNNYNDTRQQKNCYYNDKEGQQTTRDAIYQQDKITETENITQEIIQETNKSLQNLNLDANAVDRGAHRNTQERFAQDRSYKDRAAAQERYQDRPWYERRCALRALNPGPGPAGQYHFRPPYLLRQMSPGTWCRRSPGPLHPGTYTHGMNHQRRPNPENRSGRRF